MANQTAWAVCSPVCLFACLQRMSDLVLPLRDKLNGRLAFGEALSESFELRDIIDLLPSAIRRSAPTSLIYFQKRGEISLQAGAKNTSATGSRPTVGSSAAFEVAFRVGCCSFAAQRPVRRSAPRATDVWGRPKINMAILFLSLPQWLLLLFC